MTKTAATASSSSSSAVVNTTMTTIPEDDILKSAILEWLSTTDYMSVTRKMLTEAMENEHSWDLASKKDVIKGALISFVESKMASELETTADESPKKKGGGGFQKPVQLSAELAEFMKCDVAPRTQVTKEIWRYIKEHKCQNPTDGREIICDAVLLPLIKRPKIHFMKMTKELAKHMHPIYEGGTSEDGGCEDENGIDDTSKSKSKKRKASSDEEEEESAKKPKTKASAKTTTKVKTKASVKEDKKSKKTASAKDKNKTKVKAKGEDDEAGDKKRHGGFASMMWKLSPPLAELLGVPTESRPQVVSLLWKYIKEHNLQNPTDKREILLDYPLEKCFGVKSVTMFSINKHIGAHLEKIPSPTA